MIRTRHSGPVESTFPGVVKDLCAYLVQEREEGAAEISVSDGVHVWLRSERKAALKPGAAEARRETPAIRKPVQGGGAPRSETLETVAAEISECRLCSLYSTRTRTVPGQGNKSPEIMFIGEGPGEDEDRQGLAFVGRAGQLLTKMIIAMGLSRDEVFIGNIVKCRPPNNRKPLPEEMGACMPYLRRQIALLKPRVIVALGATAVMGLVETTETISKLRGRWLKFGETPMMPTYHPAYLLRTESAKKDVWADLKEVLNFLGRKPPAVSPDKGPVAR